MLKSNVNALLLLLFSISKVKVNVKAKIKIKIWNQTRILLFITNPIMLNISISSVKGRIGISDSNSQKQPEINVRIIRVFLFH